MPKASKVPLRADDGDNAIIIRRSDGSELALTLAEARELYHKISDVLDELLDGEDLRAQTVH